MGGNRAASISDAARAAHDRAVAAGREGYLDPDTGYLVFTAVTLTARGTCCGSGCRHCPYPQPRTTTADPTRTEDL